MNKQDASAVLARAATAAAELEAAGFTVYASVQFSVSGPLGVRPGSPERRRRLTPELLEDVGRLRAEGLSVREISEQYGTSIRNASRWVALARNGSSS